MPLILWPDAPLWLCGFLMSAAFAAWVKTYAGRLESRLSISPGLTHFTFPFPEADEIDQGRLAAAAPGVLDAQATHPESTLADLYDPLGMPSDLRSAHAALDPVVDGLYGLKSPSDAQRLQALLAEYQRLVDAGTLDLEQAKPKRKPQKKAQPGT